VYCIIEEEGKEVFAKGTRRIAIEFEGMTAEQREGQESFPTLLFFALARFP
jgi:hypothetical protein